MKCQYYREKGYCSKGNDPIDTSQMGDCLYKDGEITEKASIHCSEGKKQLKIKVIHNSSKSRGEGELILWELT